MLAVPLCCCTAAHDVYRYREVLQEDEILVKRLCVAGPASGEPYKPTQRLECVKVARLLSISDDVRTVSRKQLQAAVAAGEELGAAAWDGKMPPGKLRTRIGGWRVVGEQQQQQRQKNGSSSSDEGDDSCSDEEFHEVVFGNNAAGNAAAAAGSDDDSEEEQQQQQQQGGVDPDQRFYSCSDDDEKGSAAGLKDDWDVLNERFNLGKVQAVMSCCYNIYGCVIWFEAIMFEMWCCSAFAGLCCCVHA
jgi:hypothetical protein